MTAPAASSDLSGKRVLLIEDEFLVAAMLTDVLEDAGAVVLGPAANLADGLRLAAAGDFDVAVLDWNLDGERSDPIARTLMAQGAPFLISTGYGAVAAEFAGVPLLSKPYDTASVVARLMALISRD